jgi:hypothetical protein
MNLSMRLRLGLLVLGIGALALFLSWAANRSRRETGALQTHFSAAQKVAFAKTAGQRTQAVKKYDPNCVYEKGDFIYKDYDEPLTVGSKSVEHFQGAVILEVVGRTFYKHFNCDMLEVDYPGGGVFRKYVDYMKKTKTQVTRGFF